MRIITVKKRFREHRTERATPGQSPRGGASRRVWARAPELQGEGPLQDTHESGCKIFAFLISLHQSGFSRETEPSILCACEYVCMYQETLLNNRFIQL